MTDRKRVSPALTALMALLVAAAPTAALTPREVLVVANSEAENSVKLAKAYVKARNIPEENLLVLRTSTDYDVSRGEYDTHIAAPIRHHLLANQKVEKIRSICLIRGVPLRIISGDVPEPVIDETAVRRAHNRLAVDYKLLGTVGRSFPAPRTEGLSPIGKLFDSPVPEPPRPLPKFEKLLEQVRELARTRRKGLEEIADADRRRIAARQLMAIELDVFGLEGLVALLTATDLPGEPDTEKFRDELTDARGELVRLRTIESPSPAEQKRTVELLDRTGGVTALYRHSAAGQTASGDADEVASVDSELACLWWKDHRLAKMLPNPLNWRVARKLAGRPAPYTVMVSRIDGPTHEDAMRIVRASVQTEREGLDGTFYVDAGGLPRAKEYDEHLLRLAKFAADESSMKTVLDENVRTFAADACPRAALYVGWYSLRKYVDSFMWTPGAVGWHISSFGAQNLRDPHATEWVPSMIRNGVAATVGAVDEPYLGSFPLPEEFFPLLMTGKLTVAETYWRTVPSVSWRMVLIADPLYNPFAANPAVETKALRKLGLPVGD